MGRCYDAPVPAKPEHRSGHDSAVVSSRLALGSVYYYSAITTYQRLTGGGNSYWPQFAESASALAHKGDLLSAGQVFGIEIAKAGSALLLLYIGGIWLSSGYHAQ